MLLKELIRIPEHVGDQDFVLKLTDGVSGAAARQTLADYVITPALATRFEEALGLIKATLGLSEAPDGSLHQGPHQKGRAVYLHGSFGSGKSHFMAVLHRLLTRDADAMSRPELSAVVAKHGDWLGKRKFLLVPYHMLGASSLEERVFDGYCRVIGREHPEAKLPALFDTDGVIADANAMRVRLGDEAFLKLLGDDSQDSGWGDYDQAAGWTIEAYEAAADSPPLSEARQKLATALIERVFPSQTGRRGTIEFAEGLQLMSQHAKGLGYDAIVLFLDELILWLASRASTPGFIEEQADKLVNLVESDRMERPIPLIGFIARQRDLRSLIQRGMPGAQQLDIDDKLSHHEGRFTEIKLETTDLPEIAAKRLLRPVDEAARLELDGEFDQLTAGRQDLKAVLLGANYPIQDFRKVYPFSPVLVDALVQASSMLQRDRTALRAMLELLVRRRETLAVGEVIPVGDLYDVISRGNEAVSGAFKEAFERARSLYERKLLPLLEAGHGLKPHELEGLEWNDPKRVAWRADDRILKTLLLANLVSGVPALENLDAKRIATLNHGSITTRIPGQEGATVLRKLREWAQRVPEIRITGDNANPQIALELHGVDVEGVLNSAADYDNHGNRVALIKSILLEALQLKERDGDYTLEFEWRGTRRRAGVLFANVANLPLASLDNPGPEWKVVIDYPIDELPDGAVRDQRKLDEFRDAQRQAMTVVWAPRFLNHQAQQELGRLVMIERVLRSDQAFEQNSQHLSSADRAQAKSLLRGQRDTLRHGVRGYLLAAYGLSNDPAYTKALDEGIDVPHRFISLDGSLQLQPPGTGELAQGLTGLVEQALRVQFPEAPLWTKTFTKAQLNRALEIALEAAGTPNWRATLDTGDQRLMREFAGPLDLGRTESAFVLVDSWRKEFGARLRATGSDRAAVADFYQWTEEPAARGLPREVQDLLILVFAAMDQRALFRDGQALGALKLGELRPEDELRPIPMPEQDIWNRAQQVAGAVFGATANLFLTGSNVASLARKVSDEAKSGSRQAQALNDALGEVPGHFLPAGTVRAADARTTLDLFDRVIDQEAKPAIEALAAMKFDGGVSPESVGRSWRQAEAVSQAIRQMNWGLLDLVAGLHGHAQLGASADQLLEEVREALSRSELVTQLAPVLRSAERKATELMKAANPVSTTSAAAPSSAAPQVHEGPTKRSGSKWIRESAQLEALVQDLGRALDSGSSVKVEWTIHGPEGEGA